MATTEQLQNAPYSAPVSIAKVGQSMVMSGPWIMWVNNLYSVISQLQNSSSGSGTVTHTDGDLALNRLVIGNAGADIKTIPSGVAGQILYSAGPTLPPLFGSPPSGVPAGGLTDQVLKKNTNTTGDYSWSENAGPITINDQLSSYVLVAADMDSNTKVVVDSASAETLTVPASASVPADIGTTVLASQKGAGQLTIVADVGVTLNTASSLTARTRYSSVGMTQISLDVWDVFGDLT